MIDIKKYMAENKKVGQFGVSYLDNKLRAILRGDLILIGSRSGAGKSTIAQNIALANPHIKVKLLSLENFKNDDLAVDTYKNYRALTRNFRLNVRDFVAGDFEIDEEKLIQAQNMTNARFKHIVLVNRQKDYVVSKLKDDIISAADDGINLIIIDHLDYLDKNNQNDSDTKHMTEVMKTIREVQDEFKCAVIAISHLRKLSGGSKEAPVVPSMDEFHGSSNKVKEATVVIMLAPDDVKNQESAGGVQRATWCCIRKLRMGGVDNKVARLYFDTHKNNYRESYDICSVNYSGTKVELLEEGVK